MRLKTPAHVRRLVAAMVIGPAVLTLGLAAPGWAQDADKLTIAYTGMGSEVFRPDRMDLPELYPATAWNGYLIYAGPGTDRTPRPGLAKSWTISDDQLTYTFSLADAKFSDGSPVTADDVLFSLDLVTGPDSVSRRNTLRDVIGEKVAVDQKTVRITLKKPQTDFLLILSNISPYIPIVSKAYYDKVGADQAGLEPVGAGPYTISEYRRGEVMNLVAADAPWLGKPDFKDVSIRLVPEETTRVAMLKAGEADVIDISATSVADVEAAGFRVVSNPGAAYLQLGFGGQVLPTREGYDPTSPIASDDAERSAKVRHALCLAIDKDAIQKLIFKGAGEQFSVVQFLPGSPLANPAWTPIGYDPEKAKQLLAEAGYPNGFDRPLTLYINRDGAPETADVTEAVAMYWEALGLKVERKEFEDAVFQQRWYRRSDMQVMGSYLMGSTPQLSPIDWFDALSRTTSVANQLFESKDMDDLIDATLNAPTPDKAAELQQQLGDMVYDNYMHCPILLQSALYAVSNKVGDWSMNAGVRRLHNVEDIKKAAAN